MASYIHAPAARRRGPHHTALDLAVAGLLRAAMEEGWSPDAAASQLLDAVHGSARLLRQTRVRLLSRFPDYPTEIGGRALATIAFALARTRRPGAGDGLAITS